MHIATMTALLVGTEEPRAQRERTMSDSCVRRDSLIDRRLSSA